MKTNLLRLAVLVATAFVAVSILPSCAIPLPPPESVRRLAISKTDSPHLRVDKVWFDDRSGTLTVEGYLRLRLDAPRETAGKVEITVRSSDGAALGTFTAAAEPWRQQPKMRTKIAAFSCVIDIPPTAATSISIRAVES